MKFKVLSAEDCEQIRLWRNESLISLRTPYPSTAEQQANFYKDVICNRNANARYWGIHAEGEDEYGELLFQLIGMCGIENIEWINRRGEISIIIGQEYQGQGYGEQAVDMLLEQGFMYLNLENIYGECYIINPAIGFWHKIITKYNACAYHTLIKNTKFWDGNYTNSCHFNFNKQDYLGYEPA